MTDIPEDVKSLAHEIVHAVYLDLAGDRPELDCAIENAAAILADREARKAEPVAWRCFHCGAAFTENEKHAARLHFGCDDGSTPACQIKAGAEHSMLEALRRAEQDAADAIHKMHDESSEGWRAYHHVQSRLREQVTAAEELGYERGLHDNATIARLEQEKAELLKALSKANDALRPLSDAVYNDNGDMTVSIPSVTSEECIAAYFVERIITDIIAKHGTRTKAAPAQRREINDEREILMRLADGDRIVYSQDGDMGWFTDGDRAFVGNVIMDMRRKGLLLRKCDDEENYRGLSDYDTISDKGRAALAEHGGGE